MVPTYFPKRSKTLDPFGCTIKKPKANINEVSTPNNDQPVSVIGISAMLPKNKTKNKNNIK